MHNHNHKNLNPKTSPSSVYYCPMECEGEKLYFQQGRCPICNMFLVPIEERDDYRNKPKAFSKSNLPKSFQHKIGKYFCPMFCEKDKSYDSDTGCPICQMHLEPITKKLITNSQLFTNKQIETDNVKNKILLTSDSNQGKYYCPMFCEGDKLYNSNVGCPVCGMGLVIIPVKGEQKKDETYKILKQKFWISVFFSISVFILSMGGMFVNWSFSNQTQGVLELFLSSPVILYSGWFILKRGWTSFKTWNLNMFSLIALGVFAALGFSLLALLFPSLYPHELSHSGKLPLYFESVCVILTLVIMGQMLEAKAHQKTSKAIEALMNLFPETANVIVDGHEMKIALSEIKLDDIIRVKPGEKIPVDGKIIDGHSSIDEAMITGEPIAIEKNTGDKVTSGTINGNGSFLMVTEKIGEDTLLSKIIKMVNEASRSKAPIQNLADKVSKIFVPTVIIISFLTFAIWFTYGGENKLTYAFLNSVAVLIVACPCALGLATPMSLTVGIGKGAQNGILIKNAVALEEMHKINILMIDKTGTLTEGKPSMDYIDSVQNVDENEILKLASSLSKNSEHPLSNAILKQSNKRNSECVNVEKFENISGKGLKGIINNEEILLGNETLLKQFNIEIPLILSQKIQDKRYSSKTISYLAKSGKAIGFLSFSDKIKKSSKQAIHFLQSQNIEVIMMTGDNENSAKAVAEELGIKTFLANCLPEDKLKEIKKYQNNGNIVAMTGDGINDAPALAQSNIGIAMGTGTDVAIESAEITLLKGDILGIVKAKILSEKLLKNIKENLFFAFIYNVLGIPIAAGLLYPVFGILLNPMIAAAAMSFSSVSVILNSLRLNNAKLDL